MSIGYRTAVGSTTPLDVARLRAAIRRLLVYRSVFDDNIGRAWLAAVDVLAEGEDAGEAYADLFSLLAEAATAFVRPVVADVGARALAELADPWGSHLLTRILNDENPFSRECRRLGRAPDGALLAAARADLVTLGAAFALGGDSLAEAVAGATEQTFGRPVSFAALGEPRAVSAAIPTTGAGGPIAAGGPATAARARICAALAASDDWTSQVGDLAAFYSENGVGLFGEFRALRWEKRRLRGIARPDPITLGELVGYDVEREPLIRNTAHFLAGRRANNVLLYGDRGTGKSSTIKALLNEPANRDLRLIEVAKRDLGDFAILSDHLRDRPERFIVFVDDLSFDEIETEYKSLKAALEGGVETRPDNVVLYATSNRRHLVQERFSDRAEPGAEVHGLDGLQEKLSLADRFGLTVTFLAPDQDRYLAIVESLARREGIDLAPDDLRLRSLRWAAWQNGRSGRSARQFVDDQLGERADEARSR